MKRGDILREERLEHLRALREMGVDPYPAQTKREHTIQVALTLQETAVAIAGRVRAIRLHGKAIFLDIVDESGKMQVYGRADELGDRFAELELLDTGDFLAVQGKTFITKMGEPTIHTTDFQILAKTLRPIPDTWQGFKDTEERYRRRYLDLLMNPEVRATFDIRAKTFRAIREFMDSAGFTEVETPTLQPIQGGASAKPFVTHYNAYDADVFLRVAPELYLKRLLVGGYEKIFEFSRNFRNEGADPTHNPEFTAMEFYAAYWDEEQLMTFTEDLLRHITTSVLGHPTLTINNQTVSLSAPFRRITFHELTGGSDSDDALKSAVKKITEPTFVTRSPRYLIPLAKGYDALTARTIQLVIGGLEMTKEFAELNDPLDQRQQFEKQMEGRAKGDEEAQPLDEDFLEALEYGMPPTGGFGIGIDRLVALLAGQDSLRQVMYFPFMKPRK